MFLPVKEARSVVMFKKRLLEKISMEECYNEYEDVVATSDSLLFTNSTTSTTHAAFAPCSNPCILRQFFQCSNCTIAHSKVVTVPKW